MKYEIGLDAVDQKNEIVALIFLVGVYPSSWNDRRIGTARF